MTSTLTSKGQVTIPKNIREHLNVSQGDKIYFEIDEKGKVKVAAKKRSIKELCGILHRPGVSNSIQSPPNGGLNFD